MLRIDVKLHIVLVEAITRANHDTVCVLAIVTRLAHYIRHRPNLLERENA
jgi:hypothetical protein